MSRALLLWIVRTALLVCFVRLVAEAEDISLMYFMGLLCLATTYAVLVCWKASASGFLFKQTLPMVLPILGSFLASFAWECVHMRPLETKLIAEGAGAAIIGWLLYDYGVRYAHAYFGSTCNPSSVVARVTK